MKINLSEEDVKFRFITSAIEKAGWKKENIRMEHYFTEGQIFVSGNKVQRGKAKKADYLLLKDGIIPLAVIEAKKLKNTPDSGLQQAMNYAEILNLPFAYSCNGEKFVEHDFLTGKERQFLLNEFPTENELWQRYCESKDITNDQEKILLESDYRNVMQNRTARYYQRIAIDKTVQAVAQGKKRNLIVLATGTGKTFVAFQIVWKLLQSGSVKRVLYLADRNFLIDQTIQQDFSPLKKVMCKVQNKKLDSSYKVFLSLYHQLAGEEGEEPFRQFQPTFFDLIIVDECHRGSAKADSEWRKILNYFDSAVHIGMTATPKETKEVSSITYFGEPLYTYSLKQGILDGFLAPYKVVRVNIDRDLEGWRPYKGQTDVDGNLIPDEIYQKEDFDNILFIEERTKLVAKRITSWLKENGQFSKTIVFCVNQEHAELMRRALVTENSDIVKENPNYIMKITGDDAEGKKQFNNFISPDETPPIVATTAELLTTGADCKTVKLIVIDKIVESMIIFKQIIGRGTRLLPDCGKNFFTIMDFRGATKLFADSDFDGEPVVILEDDGGGKDEKIFDDENKNPLLENSDEQQSSNKKIYVRGVEVEILNERVQFVGRDGKLITENLTDYTKKNILGKFPDLKSFLQTWNESDRKQAVTDELKTEGIFLESLRECYHFDENIDDFDLILKIAYDQKPLTRKQRVQFVQQKNYFKDYPEKCRVIISDLLEKYADNGINDLETLQTLKNEPFSSFGSRKEIYNLFGGKENYLKIIRELKNLIYQAA